jgi:NifU-like protein involved in Fe-S cluster formation
MSAYILAMFDDLYNSEILTLSAQLQDSRLDGAHGSARELSKLCGSELEIDVKMEGGIVSDVALRVQACALGQSSAAILQNAIIGAKLGEIIAARDGLKAMLKSGGEPPNGRFEKLALLRGVADYPARHMSTLLAFEAAVKAVRQALKQPC